MVPAANASGAEKAWKRVAVSFTGGYLAVSVPYPLILLKMPVTASLYSPQGIQVAGTPRQHDRMGSNGPVTY